MPERQASGACMNTGEYLASNNLFILISVVVIAAVALLWFVRKPKNRHPMEGQHGRDLEERRARMNAQEETDVPPTRR
jgi:hypothetical protein